MHFYSASLYVDSTKKIQCKLFNKSHEYKDSICVHFTVNTVIVGFVSKVKGTQQIGTIL